MLLTSHATARRLEAAEAAHLAAQVRMYAALDPAAGALTLPVAGGLAARTRPEFGRKLNHVTGVGLDRPITAADLAQIEALYHPHGLPAELDLCPLAQDGTLALLCGRGYRPSAFSNTYACALTDADLNPVASDLTIGPVTPDLHGAFIEASVAGFLAQPVPRPAALLRVLAQIALARFDGAAFLARLDGQVVGSGAVAVLDAPDGPVAHLYIASTRPEARGRGVQLALLRARLAHARAQGAGLASVTARPGASARNAERAGFGLAYTKLTLVREAGSGG